MIAFTRRGHCVELCGLFSLARTGDETGVLSDGKLERIEEVPAGALFGGGGATTAKLSRDGRWIIVADDRSSFSCRVQCWITCPLPVYRDGSIPIL